MAKPSGEVLCWGANLDAQLGDGTGETRTSPVVVLGASDVTALACGQDHTCALQSTGSVICWGANTDGEVGDGTTEVRSSATSVLGISDATAIVAGNNFSCALMSGGEVSCWGSNSSGALGNGSRDNSASPVAVNGLTDAEEISAGLSHVCARRAGGKMSCWGSDGDGQLGTPGSNSPSRVPVEVAGLAGVTVIAAGDTNSCAATADGLQCWGDGYAGHLLNGKTGFEADEPTPVKIAGVTDIAQIGIGENTFCVRSAAGTIQCWGEGSSGQIGNGSGDDAELPTEVNGLSGVIDFSQGNRHLCALREGGALSCWGANYSYQINESRDTQKTPFAVANDVGAIEGTTSVVPSFEASGETRVAPVLSVGDNHACALRNDGTPFCWGSNGSGQLGNNSTGSSRGAAVNPLGLTDVIQVAVGANHGCAVRADHTVACWGNNEGGVGTGRPGISSRPVAVEGVTDAVGLALGRRFTCILHEEGSVSCFGSNSYGTLGNGSRDSSRTPIAVPGLTEVAQLAGSSAFACARKESGEVWCWGTNSKGQLGDGSNDSSRVPVQVRGLRDAVDLAAYDSNVCAVRRNGRVVCWGSQRHGALGDGNDEDSGSSNTPVEVRGIRDATAVSLGTSTGCALRRGGKVSCWGGNSFGQVGINDTEQNPVVRATEIFIDAEDETLASYGERNGIACGRNFCCSLHETGHVSCWGSAPGFGSGFLGGLVSSRSPKPAAIGFIELGEIPSDEPAEADAAE